MSLKVQVTLMCKLNDDIFVAWNTNKNNYKEPETSSPDGQT